MNSKNYIPWVEKYRPANFDSIVLDKYNLILFRNILTTNYFPNLLLYGPPGTGKTTTIINLINTYQNNNDQRNKGLMIHLNASDERGIDIIRNQINIFVNSNRLFNKGTKFVVLDEVDFMTKNAQQALKYSIQEYNKDTRFCLICNYISKIEESLQSEFVRVRFNQLPEEKIIMFLNKINLNENLLLKKSNLESIREIFKSDIRSMINYMQSNQMRIKNSKIIGIEIYIYISSLIKNGDVKKFNKEFLKINDKYNIDIKNIVKGYLNFIIKNKREIIDTSNLDLIDFLIHNPESNNIYQINMLFYIFYEKRDLL